MSTYVPQELVEYYQCHSLKESFKQLDTTLKYPYKSKERAASRASSRSPGNACTPGTPAFTRMRPVRPFPTALAFTTSLSLRNAFWGTDARSPCPFPTLGAVAQAPQPITGTLLSRGVPVGPQDGWGVWALGGRSGLGGLAPVRRVNTGRERGRSRLSFGPPCAPQPPEALTLREPELVRGPGSPPRTGAHLAPDPPGARGRASLECRKSSP